MSDIVSYWLAPFDERSADHSRELAQLHAALLAHSPVALLGPDFLRRFYYRDLPRMGLIFGQVAYVNGQPAGFIVATHDSWGFMRTAVRKHFLRVAFVMTWSVLRDPRRLGAIWEALQIMRGLPVNIANDAPQGEFAGSL